MSEYGEE